MLTLCLYSTMQYNSAFFNLTGKRLSLRPFCVQAFLHYSIKPFHGECFRECFHVCICCMCWWKCPHYSYIKLTPDKRRDHWLMQTAVRYMPWPSNRQSKHTQWWEVTSLWQLLLWPVCLTRIDKGWRCDFLSKVCMCYMNILDGGTDLLINCLLE